MNTLILTETGDFRDIAHFFHFMELLLIGITELHCDPKEIDYVCIPHWPYPSWKGKEQPHNEWVINKIFPRAKVIHKVDETHNNTLVDRAKCDHGNINKTYAKYIKQFDPYRWFKLIDLNIEPSSKIVVTYIDRQTSSKRRLPPVVHEKILKFMNSMSDITFQHLQMESLNFEEQVSAVQKTDLLIGVHGNGLTHSLFMKPRGSVCEIFVPGLPFIWDYYTLSKMMSHEYLCIFNGTPVLPYMFNLGNQICNSVDVNPIFIEGMIKQLIEERVL